MILILPFMQMKSGHHQVADAIEAHILAQDPTMIVEKIDIFNYTWPKLEKFISKSYLTWIQQYPASYSRYYNKHFNAKNYDNKLFQPFEYRMQCMLERIISEKRPQAIICTHSFPAHAVHNLKQSGKIQALLINAYTDFFISGVWPKTFVDLHLVPTISAAHHLTQHYGVNENTIVISGIPTHPSILRTAKKGLQQSIHLLIAGGNSGLGNIHALVQQYRAVNNLNISVLCGSNQKLFTLLQEAALPNVTPLPYIEDRKAMNALYDTVDAIISKPGGVTVTEAISKKIPLFVDSILPGQEQLNMKYLTAMKLVFTIDTSKNPLQQVIDTLHDEQRMQNFEQVLRDYEQQMDLQFEQLIKRILAQLPQPAAPFAPHTFNKVSLLTM